MVNKTAIGMLGVIIVASLGVGIVIGMQLGTGDAAPDTASPTEAGESEMPAGDETESDSPESTATPTENPSEQRTPIPARQFDEEEIAFHVAQFVNEERENRNESPLDTDDATAVRVSAMASNHSVAMADHGSAEHEVNGESTASRYKRNELYDRCKFKSSEGSYIRQPDEKFELIGTTYAGVTYDDGGEERFNDDERSVARALVDAWNESSTYSERMLVEEPTRMGVGVEVTSDGTVYATVDVCA